MLLTVITFWAVIIPAAVFAFCWEAAKRREDSAARSVRDGHRVLARSGAIPPCAVVPVRPRRTVTDPVSPEHPRARGARRRPASA
jgi:hypothetical protein